MNKTELLDFTHSLGAQYMMLSADRIVASVNAGVADLETQSQVTDLTTFHAFSITKTATSAAVMKLAATKKLSIDDPVGNVLPEFTFTYPFTIRHLLAHQSGIADPIPISWIHSAGEPFDENLFIKDLIRKNSKQAFRPGTRFRYSSIGYMLLSLIISRTSGESYSDYIMKSILPTMPSDAKLDFEVRDPGNHATGYHPRFSFSNLILGFFLDRNTFIKGNTGRWTAFNAFYVNGRSYGGFIGNAHGLAAYLRQYLSNVLFDDSTLAEIFREQKGGMALGWFTGRLGGEPYVCHAGGGGGYYGELRIYPRIRKASVLLTNCSGFKDQRMLDKLDISHLI